jgi:hypothetical protein
MRSVPGVEDDWMEGVLGDVVLVNGAPWPVHEVDAARYRLRLLNSSNARRYRLVLRVPGAPDLPLVQIGSDSGLLTAPVTHQALDIVEGERFDVVVDFTALLVGTEVTMVNPLGISSTTDIIRFRVVRTATDDSRVPERLADVEPLVPPPGALQRTFRFARGAVGDHRGWTINGTSFDPERSLADMPLGETEVWRFVSDVHHPVHVVGGGPAGVVLTYLLARGGADVTRPPVPRRQHRAVDPRPPGPSTRRSTRRRRRWSGCGGRRSTGSSGSRCRWSAARRSACAPVTPARPWRSACSPPCRGSPGSWGAARHGRSPCHRRCRRS